MPRWGLFGEIGLRVRVCAIQGLVCMQQCSGGYQYCLKFESTLPAVLLAATHQAYCLTITFSSIIK